MLLMLVVFLSPVFSNPCRASGSVAPANGPLLPGRLCDAEGDAADAADAGGVAEPCLQHKNYIQKLVPRVLLEGDAEGGAGDADDAGGAAEPCFLLRISGPQAKIPWAGSEGSPCSLTLV